MFGKIGGRGPLFLGNLTRVQQHNQGSSSDGASGAAAAAAAAAVAVDGKNM